MPEPTLLVDADVPGLIALIDVCYQGYGLRLNLSDPCEQHLQDPGAYCRKSGGEFWVVRDEAGHVRASAALHVHGEGADREGELKSMYVHPDWRRQGWGRRLTQLVMDEARRRGCSRMELWSDTRFDAAHAMYESLGFRRFGEREIEDSNDSREYGYRLALEPVKA